MRRFPVSAAALLAFALAGCASTSSPSIDAAPTNTPSVTVTIHSVATSSAGQKPAASPTPKPDKTCPAAPDVFLWMRVPGVPDTAQRLGGTYGANCEPSFDKLKSTAPTVPGTCTEAAWVSDNPGYDENGTPAKRLKKVQFSVGPAC
jgi:hypothetical protein